MPEEKRLIKLRLENKSIINAFLGIYLKQILQTNPLNFTFEQIFDIYIHIRPVH
jgi:hypothetical protein